LVKNSVFHNPPAFDAPIMGIPSPPQYCHIVWLEKLEWCGYPAIKKSEQMFSCFDRIMACDSRDRQMDKRTDKWYGIVVFNVPLDT